MKKKNLLPCVAVLLLLLSFLGVNYKLNQETVLEVGIFAGSNWGVSSDSSYTIIDKAVDKFEKQNPNVKIHYYSGIRREDYSEWFSRQVLQGNTPDVFFVLGEDFNQFAEQGIMMDLDEKMKGDVGFDESKFYDTTIASGKYGSHQYALPYETVPTLMFVNKTLLNMNGVVVPETDWSWEDLYEICQKVTADKDHDGITDTYGICNYNWMDAALSNGASIFDEDGNNCYFTSDEVSDSVKFIRQLSALNNGQKATTDDFDAGNVAFMPLPFAEYRTYKTYPYKIKKYTKFKWDCITMPAGPHGGNTSEINTLLMGISANTTHEKLAWEFLKLLCYDEEIQMDIFRYSQGVSALKNVTESAETESILQEDMEKNEKFIDNKMVGSVIAKGEVTPKFRKYAGANTLAENEINALIDSEDNLDNALRILQQDVEQYLHK